MATRSNKSVLMNAQHDVLGQVLCGVQYLAFDAVLCISATCGNRHKALKSLRKICFSSTVPGAEDHMGGIIAEVLRNLAAEWICMLEAASSESDYSSRPYKHYPYEATPIFDAMRVIEGLLHETFDGCFPRQFSEACQTDGRDVARSQKMLSIEQHVMLAQLLYVIQHLCWIVGDILQHADGKFRRVLKGLWDISLSGKLIDQAKCALDDDICRLVDTRTYQYRYSYYNVSAFLATTALAAPVYALESHLKTVLMPWEHLVDFRCFGSNEDFVPPLSIRAQKRYVPDKPPIGEPAKRNDPACAATYEENAMSVQLFKDGKRMALQTDCATEETFVEQFCKLLAEMVGKKDYDGDWEFQFRQWLPQFTEVCNAYRGYKTNVTTKTVYITGDLVPGVPSYELKDGEGIVALNGHTLP